MIIYRGNDIGQNGKALWDKKGLSDRSQHFSWDTVVGARFLFSYMGPCSY